ncbi:MAG: sugar ABC transporter permease, partial [Clostridia bacterium]|nr:sugar ABC transporter permease [Clostridia bacterium]
MFHRKKILWLLLLPGLAGLIAFYVAPLIGGVYFSLMDGTFANNFVGLANYERVSQNPMFQLGLKNTWELSLLCAPAIWLMAFVLAAMLKTLKQRSIPFRNVLLLPYLMPTSAMLLIWTLMFDYGGVINRLVV